MGAPPGRGVSRRGENAGPRAGFSEAIFGARPPYNLMLAELRCDDELVERHTTALAAWRAMVETRASALHDWDQRAFWGLLERGGARVHPRARAFVHEWTRFAVAAADGDDVSTDQAARRLVREREAPEGRASRFTNPRALETFSGAAGVIRLNYRWGVAQPTILDILRGLRGDADA